MIAWFICPYDVEVDYGKRLCRVCAMARYIPFVPRPDNSDWNCIDINGGYALAKVSTTEKVLESLNADPEFHDVTTRISPETLSFLVDQLGYSSEWLVGSKENILSVVTASFAKVVGSKDGIILYQSVLPTKPRFEKLDVQVAEEAVLDG